MTALGIIAFVVALLLSIMLHEAGHFLTAKRFGMKATQFFLGFGPTLFSRTRGETEYGVKAVPAGGFVKIVGMTQLEEVEPGDEDRAFWKQPAPQRAVVLAAGSTMHFLIGIVLVVAGLGLAGQQTLTTTVASVSACLPAADGTPQESCTGAQRSPAAAAGIQAGDTITALDGKPVTSWETDLAAAIRARGAGPTTVTVTRDGTSRTLTVDLVEVTRPNADGTGTVKAPLLGVSPQVEQVHLGPVALARESLSSYGQLFTGTFAGLKAIPAGIPALVDATFTGSARDANGLAGPVGIAKIGGDALGAEAPLSQRLATLLLLVAAVNVFVGVFNLLPLLPLDGGHLAILAYEQVRAGIAKVLRRPAPGRVDLARLLPVAYVVVVAFIGSERAAARRRHRQPDRQPLPVRSPL